jgi:hypothetical protein
MKIPIPIMLDILMEVALRIPSSRRNCPFAELCSTAKALLSLGLLKLSLPVNSEQVTSGLELKRVINLRRGCRRWTEETHPAIERYQAE